MELERAKAFIREQARVLSQRVNAGEILAGCVEGILQTNADEAGDSPEARRFLLSFGIRCLDISPSTNSEVK